MMSIVYSDWIGESTPTTGDGDITLGGTLQGFAPMSAAGAGDVYYTIVDGHSKETGLGYYDGMITFTRTTVIATLMDGIHTPSGARLDLSGSAQIYGTVNSGTIKLIFDRLDSGDLDTDEIYVYIDEQISEVNQAITDLSNQVNGRIDNLGPGDVGAYPVVGGDLLGKANFKNSDSGIHIDGGSAAAGTAGDFRFNPVLGLFEGYFNGKWRNVGGGTGVVWAPTAVSVNPAEVGKGYLINAAGLTITLPAAPEVGNSIGIGDYQNKNFPVTVARNGKPIMGLAENFTFNIPNASVVLSFVDNTVGWILTQGFGESQAPYAVFNKARYTNVAGQSVFNFPSTAANTVDVYYNGLKLDPASDYSHTSSTVTLAVAVSLANDIVEIYGWNQALVLNADSIVFDNTGTGLAAGTMQDAIAELAVNSIGKNRIINGTMDTWQRGSPINAPANSLYFGADRFFFFVAGAASTATLFDGYNNADMAVTGQRNAMQLTSAGTPTTTAIGQRIEGGNCNDFVGRKVTFSAWVFLTAASSSLNWQVFNPTVQDNYASPTILATGTFPPIPSQTWTKVTFTFTGVKECMLGTSIEVKGFDLSGGKSFFTTGWQVEVGSVPTEFEHRPYGLERDLCQRYYRRMAPRGADAYAYFGVAVYETANKCNLPIDIKGMRGSPTVSIVGNLEAEVGNHLLTLDSVGLRSDDFLRIAFTIGSTKTIGSSTPIRASGDITARININAEIL